MFRFPDYSRLNVMESSFPRNKASSEITLRGSEIDPTNTALADRIYAIDVSIPPKLSALNGSIARRKEFSFI